MPFCGVLVREFTTPLNHVRWSIHGCSRSFLVTAMDYGCSAPFWEGMEGMGVVVIVRMPGPRPLLIPDGFWTQEQDERLWRCISRDIKGGMVRWEQAASQLGCSARDCIVRSQELFHNKLGSIQALIQTPLPLQQPQKAPRVKGRSSSHVLVKRRSHLVDE